jgi:two-component system C4-dicarboxylate transport sensor histidine kinase DctB
MQERTRPTPDSPLPVAAYNWLMGLAIVALMAASVVMSYRLSERSGMAHLAEQANERLELYASTLESELGRYAYLPSLVAIDDDVLALLNAPDDAGLREPAMRKLARINVRAGSIRIAVTTTGGHALVSSDGARVQLPSVQLTQLASSAQRGFFMASESDSSTDYHIVQPVRRSGRLLGYIAVKINLAPLEVTWVYLGERSQSEKLLVLDDNDVVILSSVPDWKYRTEGRVTAQRQEQLLGSSRYPPRTLEPLDMALKDTLPAGARIVAVPALGSRPAGVHLALERPIVQLAVRMLALSDPSEVWRNARHAAWAGAAAAAFLSVLALYLLQRRRAERQLFVASNELQRAHDDLERQVALRTSELSSANADLERQIAERARIEDELIQAGKLAALGQMSAGITHEVNQPLTALRALSSNTLRLLKSGRVDAAADNLLAINEVTERLGRMTSRLKTFTRKAGAAAGPVSLTQAVANVRMLLEHRLQDEGAEMHVRIPEADRVICDGNRLEQVLLNLASNALDAMAAAESKQLLVEANAVGLRMCVRVVDSGGGVDDATMQRLFEPFFTTKPAGQGLGLGLAISSTIVREFGGTLRASRTTQGMMFEFDVLLASEVVDV